MLVGDLRVRYYVLAGCAGLAVLIYFAGTDRLRRRMRIIAKGFPPEWERILSERVAFYARLGIVERERFNRMVSIFLDETRITPIGCELDDTARLLVAASAVIPVFGFPRWEYERLGEVLIYPHSFRADTEVNTERGGVLGMVGGRGGAFHGIMVLSKPDLLRGFEIHNDKRNVGIHEFAHLVDKADGAIDGLPPGLSPEVLRPWMDLVRHELTGRTGGKSDIPAYAFTNEVEFFAVVSEYFFESPKKLARRHPQLYAMLEKAFRQDTRERFRGFVRKAFRKRRVGRNAPCPCGSGKKYKKCCLGKVRRR